MSTEGDSVDTTLIFEDDSSSELDWLELDVDLYVSTHGNTIGNDEFCLEVPDSSDAELIETGKSSESFCRGDEPVKKGRSKRTNSGSSSQGGKSKRPKLSSLVASERVYNFPAKMVNSLNVGNMKELGGVIEEYCVPDVILKTKLSGTGVSGRAALTHFLSVIHSSCPDMVMCISAIKLNRDCSIVFKGEFEGTYLDGVETGSASHGMIIDDRSANIIVSEAREHDKDGKKLTEEEMKELQDIDEAKKLNQNMLIKSKATYACRISFLSSKTGAAPRAPAHQLITKLEFDWKTYHLSQPTNSYDD